MANGRSPSNKEVYDLVDTARKELKSDIIRLETKFDNLEAGRLTRAEHDIGKLQINQATAGTKLAIGGFIAASVVGAVVGVVVQNILR